MAWELPLEAFAFRRGSSHMGRAIGYAKEYGNNSIFFKIFLEKVRAPSAAIKEEKGANL